MGIIASTHSVIKQANAPGKIKVVFNQDSKVSPQKITQLEQPYTPNVEDDTTVIVKEEFQVSAVYFYRVSEAITLKAYSRIPASAGIESIVQEAGKLNENPTSTSSNVQQETDEGDGVSVRHTEKEEMHDVSQIVRGKVLSEGQYWPLGFDRLADFHIVHIRDGWYEIRNSIPAIAELTPAIYARISKADLIPINSNGVPRPITTTDQYLLNEYIDSEEFLEQLWAFNTDYAIELARLKQNKEFWNMCCCCCGICCLFVPCYYSCKADEKYNVSYAKASTYLIKEKSIINYRGSDFLWMLLPDGPDIRDPGTGEAYNLSLWITKKDTADKECFQPIPLPLSESSFNAIRENSKETQDVMKQAIEWKKSGLSYHEIKEKVFEQQGGYSEKWSRRLSVTPEFRRKQSVSLQQRASRRQSMLKVNPSRVQKLFHGQTIQCTSCRCDFVFKGDGCAAENIICFDCGARINLYDWKQNGAQLLNLCSNIESVYQTELQKKDVNVDYEKQTELFRLLDICTNVNETVKENSARNCGIRYKETRMLGQIKDKAPVFQNYFHFTSLLFVCAAHHTKVYCENNFDILQYADVQICAARTDILRAEIVRRLLKAGAKVDTVDVNGRTCIWYAVETLSVEVVEALLEAKPTLTLFDKHKKNLSIVMQRMNDYISNKDAWFSADEPYMGIIKARFKKITQMINPLYTQQLRLLTIKNKDYKSLPPGSKLRKAFESQSTNIAAAALGGAIAAAPVYVLENFEDWIETAQIVSSIIEGGSFIILPGIIADVVDLGTTVAESI